MFSDLPAGDAGVEALVRKRLLAGGTDTGAVLAVGVVGPLRALVEDVILGHIAAGGAIGLTSNLVLVPLGRTADLAGLRLTDGSALRGAAATNRGASGGFRRVLGICLLILHTTQPQVNILLPQYLNTSYKSSIFTPAQRGVLRWISPYLVQYSFGRDRP